MKKILSLILAVILLLTTNVFAEEACLTDAQKEDLYKLGIMVGDENGDLRLNDTITRAEAAKMICVAGNISLFADVNKSVFDDVLPQHWAYKYIYALKENGIICGDGNGNFYPGGSVTNEEIVKMIVCLLGYGQLAEAKGGYPAGYNYAAAKIGITSNLNLKTNTSAIRKDVAVMIANSLDIPIMAKKDDGTDDAEVYALMNGKNGSPFVTIRGTRGTKWDTSLTNIDRLAQAFASQYPYKEGDAEKSIELYPDIVYLTGMEKTTEGIEYECPAIYDDRHAYDLINSMSVTPAKFLVEGVNCETQYAVFNSKILVPLDLFKLPECEVSFNKDTYVATISKNETTLEIIPNLVGMRKNRAEGYWVPLEICARFIEDILYVPLESVAKELGYTIKVKADESVCEITAEKTGEIKEK